MSIETYMAEQGKVLAETFRRQDVAAFLKHLALSAGHDGEAYDRILLVGSGSSLNALSIVRPWLQAAVGQPVEVINPAVFLQVVDDVFGTPLVVILSQSGTSSTSIEGARRASRKGWCSVVITADPDSPIATVGLPMILLPIGEEPIGPKTKGFTASIAACFMLAAGLAGKQIGRLSVAEIEAVLEASKNAASSLLGSNALPSYIVVTGSGRHYGVALEASLKIAEIAGVATAAFEPEELLHGRLHGTDRNSLVIMIASDEEGRDLAAHTAAVMSDRDVKVVLLNLTATPTPFDWLQIDARAANPLDTILASIPFQYLAVQCARERHMVPEAMTYPGLSKALAIKTLSR
ncbi:SIS domain-containing protein [Mesorhizobium sp. CAU 1741]|uniref:SIS domain-containing protein n=1 Tax=Mesorhizobium sp. CAU 1741 TaxID=3140366 RepID=UPI00325B9EFD